MPRKGKTPSDVASLARTHTKGMVRVLMGIAHSKEANPGARVAAANSLLAYGWGKPTSTVEHTGADKGPIEIADVNARDLLLQRLTGMAGRLDEHTDETIQ